MNKKLLPFLILAGLFSVCFIACKKETDKVFTPSDEGVGYFPLTVGKWITYNVDSVVWNDFDCTRKETHYQMRYTVADSFFDAQGRKSFRIEVTMRKADTLEWQPSEVISVTNTGTQLEYNQMNNRFIKLVFPVTNGTTWNGNSMINTDDAEKQYFSSTDWKYTYANAGTSFSQDTNTYDKTVTVNEANASENDPESMPSAYAYKTFAKEVYGYGIGMVYRNIEHWTFDPAPSGTGCRKGYSVTLRAFAHN